MTDSMSRTVVWFSAGAASAVAAKLTLAHTPDAVIAYTDPGAEHPDNARFVADCERWFDHEVVRLRSDRYASTWQVWEERRFLVGPTGALCTTELKKKVRFAFERPDDVQVFGYTSEEGHRADRFRQQNPEVTLVCPLIDRGLKKSDCLALVDAAGIELPAMYRLGFNNNNCIGCVKGGMGYWNRIRVHFPDVFERMSLLEREIGHSLLGSAVEPLWLDELDPNRGRHHEPVIECSLLCTGVGDEINPTQPNPKDEPMNDGEGLGIAELDDQGAHIADDGVRRDRWGGYMCRPPGSTKLVGHRRMTTVIKALDSEGGLLPWHGGRVALGMLRDPKLLAAARKLTKKGTVDAWYSSPAEKAKFKTLLTELADAGGRHERADIGTNLHSVLEAFIVHGELPTDPTARAWLDGVVEALDRAGIVIDPTYVETIVVRDADRIAGKVDYLSVTVPGYDLPVIGDLKTGDSLDYSISGYAIQLAGYRFADSIYVQGADPNGADDLRLSLPELDEHVGLIIHAPAGGEPVRFLTVDLDAGRAALDLALAVEAWRKRDDIAVELDPPLLEQLRASVDAVKATKSVAGRTGVARPPASTLTYGDAVAEIAAQVASVTDIASRRPSGLQEADPAIEATADELRTWLQARIDTIGAHAAARADLVRLWPADVPTLKRAADHTIEQLESIERVCDAVEARHSIGFGETRPGAVAAALRRITAAFPGSTIMDEPSTTQTTERTS